MEYMKTDNYRHMEATNIVNEIIRHINNSEYDKTSILYLGRNQRYGLLQIECGDPQALKNDTFCGYHIIWVMNENHIHLTPFNT